MSAVLKKVSERVWVAGQIGAEDLDRARDLGVSLVINNRPDGETPGQPSSAEVAVMAADRAMTYVHVPIAWGAFDPVDVQMMADAMDEASGGILAFCRSGARSCHLWAMIAARDAPPSEIAAAASAQGYDLGPSMGFLERIHQNGAIL